MTRKIRALCMAAALLSAVSSTSTPAQAVNVTFSGSLANLCILTLTTPGIMAISTDGSRIGSAETGGVPATLTVIGTGNQPSLAIGAPSLSGPSGTSGATTTIAYTSLSGANQAYTSSASSTPVSLIDTLTFNARVAKSGGFPSGSYTVTTVVTCSQP